MTTRHSRGAHRPEDAFARADLAAVLALLTVVAFLVFPMAASSLAGSHRITCLSNLKRLGQAFLLYASDNQGYAPHPTWGSDLTGPSGWAYATRNDGRFPEAGPSPRTQEGKTFPPARRAQLPFLKMGQVWSYIVDEEAYLCPADVAEWNSRPYQVTMIARPWKLSTYTANGATIGYGAVPGPPGTTTRLSWFRADDALIWEQTEQDGFSFNDAGSLPTPSEGISARHDGGGHLAAADGSAGWMNYGSFVRLSTERVRNRLWCYPLTTTGGSQ